MGPASVMMAARSKGLNAPYIRRRLGRIPPTPYMFFQFYPERNTTWALFTAHASPPSSKGRRKKIPWVPAAYRGGDTSRSSTREANGSGGASRRGGGGATRTWKRGIGPTTSSRQDDKSAKHLASDSVAYDMRDQEKNLVALLQDFLKHAVGYRRLLRSTLTTNVKGDGGTSDEELLDVPKISNSQRKELLAFDSTSLADRIHEYLDGLQDADGLVDEEKLKATEETFQSLCKSMHHMGTVASSLSNLARADRAFTFYISTAETILVALVRLLQERCLLVEAARQWGDKAKRKADQGKEGQRNAGVVSKWLNDVINSILSPISKGDQQSDEKIQVRPDLPSNNVPLALLGKPLVQATQQLLTSIVTTIISHTTSRLDGSTTDMSDQPSEISLMDRKKLDAAAEHVLGVLENVPTSWDATSDALIKTVQLLSAAGSYKSAQKCRLVFERHGASSQINEHVRLSSVLQAYLAALQQNTTTAEIHIIVDEAYDFLLDNWETRTSSVCNERLQAVSVMLRIIAFNCWKNEKAKRKREIKRNEERMTIMCQRADALLQKAIGNESASELLRQIDQKDKDISVQLTPLLDPLAFLYASSGDAERIELAWKMLDHMMNNEGQGRFFPYPTSKTCNAILKTLLDKYTKKTCDTIEGKEEDESEKDLSLTNDLLSFMYKRTEADCIPDKTTLLLTMKLLNVTKPSDEGFRAQKILSMVESHYLLANTGSQKGVALSLYHLALQSWLSTSSQNDGTSDLCCAEQALWMVERMELRSTPVFMSDKLLKASAFPYLYDTGARPTEQTYQMVLPICVATSNEDHFEKAAEIALRMAKKLVSLEAFHDLQSGQLRACADKIQQESALWNEIDSFLCDVAGRASSHDTEEIISDPEEGNHEAVVDVINAIDQPKNC